MNDKYFCELLEGCGGFEIKLREGASDSGGESDDDGADLPVAHLTVGSGSGDAAASAAAGGDDGVATAADFAAEGLAAPPPAPAPKPTFRVRLFNLPYSAWKVEVREFCSGCSHVEGAEIEHAPDGRHAGTAIVEFGTEAAAIAAIDALHGQSMGGRVIRLKGLNLPSQLEASRHPARDGRYFNGGVDAIAMAKKCRNCDAIGHEHWECPLPARTPPCAKCASHHPGGADYCPYLTLIDQMANGGQPGPGFGQQQQEALDALPRASMSPAFTAAAAKTAEEKAGGAGGKAAKAAKGGFAAALTMFSGTVGS